MRRLIFLSICILFTPMVSHAAFGDITPYLSKPLERNKKRSLTQTLFDFPEDITFDSEGRMLFADTFNHVIRRATKKGKVKTIAGRGSYGDKDGDQAQAEFAYPKGVDASDDAVFIADSVNGKIKKLKGGQVSTLVSGLNGPEAVKVQGSTLYFLDTGNNALKKVSINGGSVTTVTASLSNPKKLSLTSDGSFAYIADAGSRKVKKVNLSSGAVSTVAGSGEKGKKDGSCSTATFNNLWGVHVHDDDTIFVSAGDGFDDRVRKIDLSGSCTVSTFASDTNMQSINFPRGLTTRDGELYVAATGIGFIYQYNLDDVNVNEKYAGKNRFNVRRKKPVLFGNPKSMVLSKNKKWIFISENNRIRKIKRSNKKKAKLVAGNIIDNYVTKDNADNNPRVAGEARFSDITTIVLSKDGTMLYAVDRNNNRIREVNIKTREAGYLTGAGMVNMVAGDDNGFANGDACPNEFDQKTSGCAYFNRPQGAVLSKNGDALFVTDTSNNRIRKVVVTGDDKGKVTTVAGSGSAGLKNGTGTEAQFNAPIGITRSKNGKALFVADRDNHVIRKIVIKSGKVTTYAGTGALGSNDGLLSEAIFSFPEWIHRGKDNNYYISEAGTNQIRMIDRKDKVTKLVTGSGVRGYTNGSQSSARLNNPKGLLSLNKKTLLVAELFNDTIRKVDISGAAPFSDPAPEVTGVLPQSIEYGWFTDGEPAAVTVNGANFRHGAEVYVGPYKADQVFVQSDSSLAVHVPYTKMEAGYYTLRVVNTDGQSADIVRGLRFTINGQAPVVDFFPE